MSVVATAWADSLRHMLSDQTTLGIYLSQLGGNCISSPYVIPDRRRNLKLHGLIMPPLRTGKIFRWFELIASGRQFGYE